MDIGVGLYVQQEGGRQEIDNWVGIAGGRNAVQYILTAKKKNHEIVSILIHSLWSFGSELRTDSGDPSS
jgi:hypothetical protein